MKDLDAILARATAGIEDKFFRLPIDGGAPVFRERVYCYELYHQMRMRWTKNSKFTLNGEVDKKGHALLRDLGIRLATPDFLIHTPGLMNGNHAIIEVKHTLATDDIKKDLRTLRSFVSVAGYKRAIYLVFGCPDTERVVATIAEINSTLLEDPVPVELWLHEAIGVPAKCYCVLTSLIDRDLSVERKPFDHSPVVPINRKKGRPPIERVR